MFGFAVGIWTFELQDWLNFFVQFIWTNILLLVSSQNSVFVVEIMKKCEEMVQKSRFFNE